MTHPASGCCRYASLRERAAAQAGKDEEEESRRAQWEFYPEEQLMKILWPGLRQEVPATYEFLKRFNYSTAD